jgi:type 1 fimbriae regulatory protein FimB/type 1 fimbriae regulatory protein FimE
MPSVHPMRGSEIRDLRRLKREEIEGRHVFLTERRAPISTAGFRKMLARVGETGKFPFPVQPHMLRHACGYKSWRTTDRTRGRCSITSVARTFNTQFATRNLSPERFKSFWED